MRLIVAGGREFDDYALLSERLDFFLSLKGDHVEIVSGKARGADSLGERYAKEKGYPIKEFPADWEKNKKAAGPIRNRQMAEYADACIVFWDGKSRGTRNMMETARQLKLPLKIVRYDTRKV